MLDCFSVTVSEVEDTDEADIPLTTNPSLIKLGNALRDMDRSIFKDGQKHLVWFEDHTERDCIGLPRLHIVLVGPLVTYGTARAQIQEVSPYCRTRDTVEGEQRTFQTSRGQSVKYQVTDCMISRCRFFFRRLHHHLWTPKTKAKNCKIHASFTAANKTFCQVSA